jgi:Xaa-Pro aminopeptidase
MGKSDYSEAEIQDRVERVRKAFLEKGMDALIVYDENGIIGGGNVRWLAGYSHTAPPVPSFAVLGKSGDPIICFSEGMGGTYHHWHELFGTARRYIAYGGNALRPDVVGGLAQALSEVGFTGGKLGIDGLHLMRYLTVEGLKQKVPNAEIVNAARLTEYVRRVKSEAELANYRKASQLSHLAMDVFMNVVQPGILQSVAVAEAVHVTEAQGAEALDLIHGTGDPWFWGMEHRGDLTFKEGDLVACELNARWHGFFAQVCRTWGLGKISPEKDKLISAVRAAEERMLSVIKPGLTGREVFLAGLEEVKKRGYDFCGVRFGHGLGLTIGEGFDFADWDNDPNGPCLSPIPEGAFGVFHPFLIEKGPDGKGAFNALWGDPWVLRAHGPEMV